MLCEKSQNVLMKKAKEPIAKSPAFIDFLESIKPEQVFDVNMSGTARELYEKGELVLTYSTKKDGQDGLIPTLSGKDGKFFEQVTLNQRNISPELSSTLSNLSMQQQLT